MSNSKKEFRFETLQVHGGQRRDINSHAVPIYASTSFVFNSSAHGADIFSMKDDAYAYSRLANPTVDVFEKRVAQLEGGIRALASASGEAALIMTITTLAKRGDNIICSSDISEASSNILRYRISPFGIEPRFIDTSEVDKIQNLVDEKTKGIFIESISSTQLLVADTEAIAKVAHEAGLPLIVDNTAGAGGFFVRPIDHGADIVIQSASEWMSVNGQSSSGIIVDSGRFDWRKHSKRFPQFTEPSPGFHGINIWEKFGNSSFIVLARAAVLRDIGPCLNAFAASELITGLQTLALRLERQSSNALALATWLADHDKIELVSYPGLLSQESYQHNAKYLRNGAGAVLSFVLKPENIDPSSFSHSLDLVSTAGVVGGSKTVIIEPLSSLINKLSISPDNLGSTRHKICVSVGLEHIDDIISDFQQSLANV